MGSFPDTCHKNCTSINEHFKFLKINAESPTKLECFPKQLKILSLARPVVAVRNANDVVWCSKHKSTLS